MATEIEKKVMEAKMASITLASVDTRTKDRALEAMAIALDENRDRILEANKADLEEAGKMMAEGKLSQALVDRLKVSNSKIDGMISGIRDVIKLEDPSGKTLKTLERLFIKPCIKFKTLLKLTRIQMFHLQIYLQHQHLHCL